jgi:hypothetical protein
VVARSSRAAVATLLGAVALAGCGGGSPATRGFDSREVLPVRDPSLDLWTLTEAGGNPTLIYSTEPPGTTVMNYWSLDITTGNVESLGTEQPASITAQSGPYICWTQVDPTSGVQTLEIFDFRTSTQTPIDGVISYAACPESDGWLTVFRADPTTGSPVLWTGPFLDLQPVALSMDVEAVGQWLSDVRGTPIGVLVAAAATDQPGAFGLYTFDLGTTTFTEDVPATAAGTAWAAGAAPTGSLQSSSLATGAAQAIGVMGDHYVYARTMSDGGTTMFAGPFTTGPASELALFQANAIAVSTAGVTVYSSSLYGVSSAEAPFAAWSPASVAANNSTLMVWDEAARTVVACPSSPGAVPSAVLSPDSSRALFADFSWTGAGPAAITLLSLGAGAGGSDDCRTLALAGGNGAGFSPDGQALFWTIATGPIDGEIWAAAGDGSDPRMIGSGAISLVNFLNLPGSERLEFYLDSDFVWVDLGDDPIVLHDVVQQVFEGYANLGNSWLLIGYNFNTQDGTGTLGLVDRDTGATRPISPAVASFKVAVARTPADAGAPDAGAAPDGGSPALYDVVYVVRGRNPSPQDGIWIARVSAADLQ